MELYYLVLQGSMTKSRNLDVICFTPSTGYPGFNAKTLQQVLRTLLPRSMRFTFQNASNVESRETWEFEKEVEVVELKEIEVFNDTFPEEGGMCVMDLQQTEEQIPSEESFPLPKRVILFNSFHLVLTRRHSIVRSAAIHLLIFH
jgi:hypothetical protein